MYKIQNLDILSERQQALKNRIYLKNWLIYKGLKVQKMGYFWWFLDIFLAIFQKMYCQIYNNGRICKL